MLVTRHGTRAVRLADGEGEARARRRHRLEAQILQKPGAARVPGIGDDEGAGLFMQGGEDPAFFLLRDHDYPSQKSLSCSPGMGGRLKPSVASCRRSRL